jgi:hypothetical protein
MTPIVVTMEDGGEYVLNRLLAPERSNAKLRKSTGSDWLLTGLSFAPAEMGGYQVCSSSSPGCRKCCIFTSGNGQYPSVWRGRLARKLAWFQNRDAFKEKLLFELGLAQKLADRKGKRLGVRLNVFSDVMWERQFPEIFRKFPRAQMYDYTKHENRMMRFIRGDFPSNYYLTFSRSEENEDFCLEVLNAGRNVSVPFTLNKAMHPDINVPMPTKFWKFPVFNGEENDLRFLDPQAHVIGIKTKGMGFWDDSGFVVDMMGAA